MLCSTEKTIKYSFNQLLWIMDFEFTDEEEKSSKTTKSVNIHGYCYVFQKEGGFRGDFFILSLN